MYQLFFRGEVLRIQAIHVQNFRCLRDCSITFDELTAIIGENNAGKSAFLKAIDAFFGSETTRPAEDYCHQQTDKTITISITFGELTSSDHEHFNEHLISEKVTITREFNFHDAKKEGGAFFAEAEIFSGFEVIRSSSGDAERKKLYNEIREDLESDILAKVSKGSEIEPLLLAWENANKDKLTRVRKGRAFGFSNVALGKLRAACTFRLIPAVQDASNEIDSDRSSPVRQLVADIVRQTIENQQSFKDFKKSAAEQIREITDPKNIPSLQHIGDELTTIVSKYYERSKITANITPIEDIPIEFPKPRILVEDNEFVSIIENLGHGLQRAVLLSVIEFMATRSSVEPSVDKFDCAQSDIILAIEEPEIYQHPIKQRLFSRALQGLCKGFNSASGIRFQIILVTHSPLFVEVREAHRIRLVRRVEKSGQLDVTVSTVSLDECAKKTAAIQGYKTNLEKYKLGLHVFNYNIAEGLFSKAVIMVEGETDRAFLEGHFISSDFDPLTKGLTISPVNGKTNLDKPISIFSELGIPVFSIADNDQDKVKDNPKINRLIQTLSGVPSDEAQDFPVGIFGSALFLESNLETYVRSKVNQSEYGKITLQLSEEFNSPLPDCQKSPHFVSALFVRLRSIGAEFKELDALVSLIQTALP